MRKIGDSLIGETSFHYALLCCISLIRPVCFSAHHYATIYPTRGMWASSIEILMYHFFVWNSDSNSFCSRSCDSILAASITSLIKLLSGNSSGTRLLYISNCLSASPFLSKSAYTMPCRTNTIDRQDAHSKSKRRYFRTNQTQQNIREYLAKMRPKISRILIYKIL